MATRYFIPVFVLMAFMLCTASSRGQAHDHGHSNLVKVENVHAFATTSQAKTGAAFMTVTNHGDESDRLINVTSDIAEHTEIHQNYINPDDDTMMMRKIKDIEIKAHETVKLEPAGYHIMLINLNAPLKKEDSFPLTLEFEKSGAQTITVDITAPGKTKNMSHDHHGHH